MKFMIIVKATKDSEAGVMPSEKMITIVQREMAKAGVLLTFPDFSQARQGRASGFRDKRTVIDVPSRNQELRGLGDPGEVQEEAIEWATRCPNPMVRARGRR